jgi:cobalt-zinc-cadmium efflux system membrane fusion protein
MTASHRPFPRLALALFAAAAACTHEAPQAPAGEAPRAPSNRIDVPEAVRNNLGIRYVEVERRRVAATLRLPGRFELLPDARHEHRAAFAGRVTLRVQPLQVVAAGDVLYELDAPAWRDLQRELAGSTTEIELVQKQRDAMQPLLAAHKAHEESLQEALAVLQQRLRDLQATKASVGGQAQELTDVRVQLAQVQAQLAEAAEQHTDAATRLATFDADERRARDRRELALASAAAALATGVAELTARDGEVERWRQLATLPVRASRAGVVEPAPLASGAWVEAHALVAATVDPQRVRFHVHALQGDAPRLRDGLPVRITPAGRSPGNEALAGTLQLGLSADATTRTFDAFVAPTGTAAFARPGIAGYAEIELASSERAELAIPRSAALPDGLVRVIFRRDPKDPDKVERLEADLGRDDGAWVEVKSGLVDGDEVVLEGAYELVLASSASVARGGHFHADGTWHADDHK